jgi:hypothetical protein
MKNPFRYFNSSPEVIRLTVMMYIRYFKTLLEVIRLAGMKCIRFVEAARAFRTYIGHGPNFAS